MEITWLGQASFSFNSRDVVLVTDPQNAMSDSLSPNKQPDIITYSHTIPFDQPNGSGHTIAGPGEYEISHFYLSGMGTILKRDSISEEPSVNTIYTIRVEGLTLCHLGYLTQKLAPAQIDQLGQPQILLGPVSGEGILSISELQETISSIQPRVFLPLQYSADESSNGQSPLGKFLSEMGTTDIDPLRRLNLTETNLPGELRVVTMEPTR